MEKAKSKSISTILAAAITLNFFWITNIFKEANKSVSKFLNFYNPTGPLLGLFIISLVLFFILIAILYLIFRNKLGSKDSQKFVIWFYIVSVILFFFMVFPPVFEPIVEILSGK